MTIPSSRGETQNDRGLIYYIYCHTNEKLGKEVSHHLILEMQRARQQYFEDRAVYYVSHGLARQGIQGPDCDFKLVPIWGIFLMNFKSGRKTDNEEVVDVHMLMNPRTNEPLSNVMRLYFIILPLLRERAEKCKTEMEKWFFIIKNLKNMSSIPFEGRIFRELENIASVANLSKDDLLTYERELKYEHDRRNQMRFAVNEAMEKGRAKGLAEGKALAHRASVKNLVKLGLSESQIAQCLEISVEEVRQFAREE